MYQSKYTGQEIDELLDSIKNNGGNIKTLFEGKLTAKGQTGTLSDSIDNYDAIVCLAGHENGTNTSSQVMPLPEINKTYVFGFYWLTGYSYAIVYRFTDSTTIEFNNQWIESDSWEKLGAVIHKVVGIKFNANVNAIISPIGSIVPIMGTKAPKDHLVCDGSIFNINEYRDLANYFQEQFGSKNHFGGDGITTFAVPDLRNEFLRGYGDLSGEIGIHQEGTSVPHIVTTSSDKQLWLRMPSEIHNPDKGVRDSEQIGYTQTSPNYTTNSTGSPTEWIVRPTNVAVLFCIKYKGTATGGGSGYSETEILSQPTEYPMGVNGVATHINQDLNLTKDVSEFNKIIITYEFKVNDGKYYHRTDCECLVSNIVINNTDTQLNNGDRRTLIHLSNGTGFELGYWFKSKAIRVYFTSSNQTDNTYTHFRISSVKGIKY